MDVPTERGKLLDYYYRSRYSKQKDFTFITSTICAPVDLTPQPLNVFQ